MKEKSDLNDILDSLEESVKKEIKYQYEKGWVEEWDEDIFSKTRKSKSFRKRNTMKKCDVNMPDGNGNVDIAQGSVFVTPTHSGFLVFNNPDGTGIQIHCCPDWDAVKTFFENNTTLDLTQEQIVDNV